MTGAEPLAAAAGPPARDGLRRRELLGAGAAAVLGPAVGAAGAAALLGPAVGAAGAAALLGPAAARAAGGDQAVLSRLIDLEQQAAFAYEQAGLARLADQEAQHAAALATELVAYGLQPPPAPTAVTALGPAAASVAAAHGSALRDAALALEAQLAAAHRDALVALAVPKVVQTAATVLASHSQHEVLLIRSGLSNR